MATRSPGIYYNEIDNTQYTNPEAISGTTLAVVGYATKGPEGVPVEINSWQKFLEIFGKPVKGMYSGLAVKNYLQAGGTVLFTRVFDEDLASPSSYTVRNGKPAVPAVSAFNHKGDVLQGTVGFEPGKLYSFNITTTPETSRDILVRTMKNKKLTQASIIQQIKDQLSDTDSVFEWKLSDSFANKLYQFKENTNDYFLDTTGLNKKEDFANKLNNVLNNPNGVTEIFISSVKTGENDTTNKFSLKGTKTFKINENRYSIKVDNLSTAELIVEEINKSIVGSNVKAVFKKGNEGTKFNSILFINTNGTVAPIIKSTEGDVLFVDREGISNQDIKDANPEVSENEGIYVTTIINPKNGTTPEDNKFAVAYDDNSGDIIIKAKTVSEITDIEEYAKFDSVESLATESKNHIYLTKPTAIEGVSVIRDIADNKIKLTHATSIAIKDSEETFTSSYKPLGFVNLMGGVKEETAKNAILEDARDMIKFTSKEKGSGTSDITVEVTSMTNPLDSKDQTKNLKVYSNGILKESFENISLNRKDIDSRFDTILKKDKENGGSSLIIADVTERPNEDFNESIELPDGVWKLGQTNMAEDTNYYEAGNDGIPEDNLTAEGIFSKVLDPKDSSMANKDLFDFHIIIIPDAFNLDSVQDACIKLCKTRGDAVTIVDPPMGLDKKAVIDWHNGVTRGAALDSNYAAVYWPWCKVLDTSSGTGKFAWVMPSVVMAAQYVRVDINAGPQTAPAGELNGRLPVIDIQSYPNESDRDELYVNYNRINPIVKFKDGNVVVYGEKTTQRKESVLTKIHTRRMLVQIKKQCRGALRRYLFMPNTTDYLGKVSNDITSILEAYKANGGLNFYKVICDETNNTIETRQQDIINVDAILVPQGTIEQINISLTLNKTAETVSD